MEGRLFRVVQKAVGVGWPLAVLGLAVVAVPHVALQARDTRQGDPAPQQTAALVDTGSGAFDQSLVTANIVAAGQLGETSARQAHIGGQGWHLVYAGQR